MFAVITGYPVFTDMQICISNTIMMSKFLEKSVQSRLDLLTEQNIGGRHALKDPLTFTTRHTYFHSHAGSLVSWYLVLVVLVERKVC